MFHCILSVSYYDLSASIFILLQGMAGIFVFMAVFYLLIYGLDKYLNPREDK